jgi:hypothetical protein
MTETFVGSRERKATDLCGNPLTFRPSAANNVEGQDQSTTASTAIELPLRADSGHFQTDKDFGTINSPLEDDGLVPAEICRENASEDLDLSTRLQRDLDQSGGASDN